MTAAPLRRADWRYLLPAAPDGRFRHLLLLGGPAGLADLLAAERVADRISSTPKPGADAVVALRNSGATTAELARCAVAGAVVYREIDRRRPGMLATTPARLARSLSAAGLTPVSWHWVLPGFDRARRYLPLDRPEAIEWYFSTLHPAGSIPGWLAARAVEAISRGGPGGLAAVVPCFAATAVMGPAPARPPSVLALPALPDRVRADRTGVVMLTSGQDDGSRVVLLPFPPGATAPSAVVKVSRTARFDAHTEREQATLTALRAGLDPDLRPSIPEPGGLARYGGSLVALESYAPGAAMVHAIGRRGEPLARSLDELRAAADWLTRFHRQSAAGDPAWPAAAATRVADRLADYRRLAGSAAEAVLLDRTALLARELVGAALPTVWVHNDFGPWNIHRAGTRITVIDWELGPNDTGTRRGPALADLIYFVTEWHLRARRLRGRRAELRGFRDLFLPPTGPAALAARDALRGYMAGVGVDPRFLPLLLVVTWVERALERAERQATAGRGGRAEGANRYAEYVTLMARRRDQLFGGAAW